MEEKQDVQLSEFSIQLGLAVDKYINAAVSRIMFLESKIIEYYKKTDSKEFAEFFDIKEELPNDKQEEAPTKPPIPEKKPKMRVVK